MDERNPAGLPILTTQPPTPSSITPDHTQCPTPTEYQTAKEVPGTQRFAGKRGAAQRDVEATNAAHRIAETLMAGPRAVGTALEVKPMKTKSTSEKKRAMTREEMTEMGFSLGVDEIKESEPCLCVQRMEEEDENLEESGWCHFFMSTTELKFRRGL